MNDLYIDLIEKCILGLIYEDPAQDPWSENKFDLSKRILGRDWPLKAHSMIGKMRMDNLRFAVNHVLDNNIPGDFIETGSWRGGACIFMRAILKSRNISNRLVYVADSFEGLPLPDPSFKEDVGDNHHSFKELAVSIDEVKSNFQKYDLLDSQVTFMKGWFKDTLPKFEGTLALLRLDGDMYQSTMEGFINLYDKVSSGGIIIVDDYGAVQSCKKAVHDFIESRNLDIEIKPIDGLGVYWIKR